MREQLNKQLYFAKELAQEAGEKDNTYDGSAWSSNIKTIVASNSLIHDDLLDLVIKG